MIVTAGVLQQAIAARLKALWPERRVYTDEMPTGADGHFYVGVTEALYTKKLDLRREREYQFDVMLFLKSDSQSEYWAWAETMFVEFGTVSVGDQLLYCFNRHAEVFDRIGHMLFTIRVSALTEPEPGELMGQLAVKERIKRG